MTSKYKGQKSSLFHFILRSNLGENFIFQCGWISELVCVLNKKCIINGHLYNLSSIANSLMWHTRSNAFDAFVPVCKAVHIKIEQLVL